MDLAAAVSQLRVEETEVLGKRWLDLAAVLSEGLEAWRRRWWSLLAAVLPWDGEVEHRSGCSDVRFAAVLHLSIATSKATLSIVFYYSQEKRGTLKESDKAVLTAFDAIVNFCEELG